MKFPIKKVFDMKFVKVFDIQFAPGRHYLDATRRDEADLIATKTIDELRGMIPDAVSCEVVLERHEDEPLLLLAQEYRYPIGQYVLSVPAGLIDAEDRALGREDAVRAAAIRELKEETGITFKDGDTVDIINPMLFSSPGITDENNAMIRITIHDADLSELTQAGCEGSELFDGFELMTAEEAGETLERGCDSKGMFYSVYTWIALADFTARY